jgi:hypothetical protein
MVLEDAFQKSAVGLTTNGHALRTTIVNAIWPTSPGLSLRKYDVAALVWLRLANAGPASYVADAAELVRTPTNLVPKPIAAAVLVELI